MDLDFKNHLAPFYYEQINLKALSEEDLPDTLKWRNEYRQWFNTQEPLSLDQHLKWFDSYKNKTNDFVFIVRDQEENRVGQVAIYNIDWSKKEGEFGRFLVNPDFSGRSYMKKSAAALLEFCTRQLQLKSIYLEVKPHNEKAIHIYSSVGFVVNQSQKNNNILMVHSC